jgi:hypothetical protein
MKREKGVEQPIWNFSTAQCGPDILCEYYRGGACWYPVLGENTGKLVCPNPICEKRKIVGYQRPCHNPGVDQIITCVVKPAW